MSSSLRSISDGRSFLVPGYSYQSSHKNKNCHLSAIMRLTAGTSIEQPTTICFMKEIILQNYFLNGASPELKKLFSTCPMNVTILLSKIIKNVKLSMPAIYLT